MTAGTFDTVTRSLRVPLYSGCSLKCLVTMLFAAAFAACSSVGNRTSHVAKLLRQKYWHGCLPSSLALRRCLCWAPQAFSFWSQRRPARGSWVFNFSTNSGMGSISFPLKYLAYLPTLSLSKSAGPLCWPFQAVGLFWAGCIGLSWLLMISCVSAGTGNEGQFAPIRLSCVESFLGGGIRSRGPLHGCWKMRSQEGKI